MITATELFLYLEEQLMPPPGSGRPRQTPILWPLAKHDKGQFVFLVPGRESDLPAAPSLDPDANPWRGLKPYESTHADLFFGRRQASERLLERVLRNQLVAVTGPSGIGKSSLVRAGLTARRLLERLVSVESGEFARRRVPRRELEAADPAENVRILEILRRLDDARLIVTDEVENEPCLELAHDALILGWDKLLNWVRQDAPAISLLRLLSADATRWDQSFLRKPRLLWSDPARLESVIKLRDEPFPGLNKAETQFAGESIRHARRLSIVRRAAIIGLVLLTFSAIGASIYAVLQQNRAEARLRDAQISVRRSRDALPSFATSN